MTQAIYDQLVTLLGEPQYTIVTNVSVGGKKAPYGMWTPVIDRAASDCVYGNRKGCWDWLVANRVDANMSFLKAYLYQYGWSLHIKEMPFVYTREQYFRASQYKRICDNYSTLIAFLKVSSLEPVYHGAGEALHYNDINILESFVVETLDTVLRMYPGQFVCGTFSCGET